MASPELTIHAARRGMPLESTRTLDLVALVQVPTPDTPAERSPVSLALVLDRSGSMRGDKIAYARAGASAALGQLGPGDRVSLTTFDDKVEVLQQAVGVKKAAALHAKIALIEPGASTDLHGGWAAGAATLSGRKDAKQPRRVVLLTDGLANHGVTDAGAIAAAVAEAARRGIATSALGIGEDYNEDLLETIARSGDGSYYYVEEPDQLPGLFEAELRGFKAVVGRKVSVAVFPGVGFELVGLLNDFPASPTGAPVLPNLLAGGRQTIGFSLRALAPLSGEDEHEVCVVQLAWNDEETGERREIRRSLRLPLVGVEDFDGLPVDTAVAETVGLLRSARAKRQATQAIDRNDTQGSTDALDLAKDILAGLPVSPALEKERASIASLEKDLAEGRLARFRKNAHYESYSRSHAMDQGKFDGHINRKLLYLASRCLTVIQGDLAETTAQVLVNSRLPGGGLDEHLRSRGGAAFRAECEALGDLPVGTVCETSGGDLRAQRVLHASVPAWNGGLAGATEALADVYRACFQTALQKPAHHLLAFPLLGFGRLGFPLETAATVAALAAATFVFQMALKARVVFVVKEAGTLAALESLFQRGSL